MLAKGACKFCNQIYMVDEEDPDYIAGERNLEKVATMRCTCEASRLYQFRENQKDKAYDNIDLAFNDYESLKNILRAAVNSMVDSGVVSITIKNDQGVTGKMTVGAKGNIKVSRTISKKVEYDE